MSYQHLSVLFIARPLIETLATRPFSGRVLGRFERVCNLVDGQGRVIALTLPEVGKGPFSIIVAGRPGLFSAFKVDQPAYIDKHRLIIGNWRVDLSTAKAWEPRLTCPERPLDVSLVLAKMLRPYTHWLPLLGTTPAAESAKRLADVAASQLTLALIRPANGNEESLGRITAAVRQLAGLGGGLTPAGDDYLIGVMAALWLTGYKNWPPSIAAEAAPKTTTLSAAFLRAAGRGEFFEPWHKLAQALFTGVDEVLSQTLGEVAQFGASSGLDALAGFATTVLALTS